MKFKCKRCGKKEKIDSLDIKNRTIFWKGVCESCYDEKR